jgi:Restriction endonuclease XhoI
MYSERFEEAIRRYWVIRKEKTVRGGKQLDAIAELVAQIFVDQGFPESSIQHGTSLELPGYYRPEKKWDLLVVHEGILAAAIEFKSQVGSFGKNFNNRAEEAVGSATDIWTAYREGRFGDVRPWLGYLFLLENAPEASRPVGAREPFFEIDEAFKGASYKERYEIFCRRLVRERLYDAACFVTSSEDPGSSIEQPASDLSFSKFAAEIKGRAKALLEIEKA